MTGLDELKKMGVGGWERRSSNFYGLNRVNGVQWKRGLDFQSEKLSSVPSLVTNKNVAF